MTEMQGASTNIGGILSAMVYQIEQDSLKNKKTALAAHNVSIQDEQASLHEKSVSNAPSQIHSQLQSIDVQSDQGQEEKNKLISQLDDMYNSLVIEHGVVTTDYSHQFKQNKVTDRMDKSPY